MLVVADASPINVLVRIQRIEVLPALFGRVLIPPAVQRELTHSATPVDVREYVTKPPSWLEREAIERDRRRRARES